MIYIRKQRTPAEIEEKAEEIKKTPGSGYEKLSLPEDSDQLRVLFDQMPKDEIRENLYREQHGLGTDLVNAMQKDIDEVLHLNGEKDAAGNFKGDTSSRLVASRRSICDSVCSQFERWDKRGVLTADFLQDKIAKLENQLQGDTVADEYIGVRLYLYKRKAEKLIRKR